MSSRSYIPRTQDALLAFAVNDAALLIEDPSKYGVTVAEAAQFNNAVQDYKAKMDVINNPATKTKAAVQLKNESLLMMLYIIRPLLQYIKGNAGVADDAKVALGLTVGVPTPTPVPVPTTEPLLNVSAGARLQQMVRFADSTTPDKRARPAGMIAMELVCQIGDTPTVNVANAKSLGLAMRQSHTVTFSSEDIGKSAHYWGRWINRRGEPGPWSQVASLTIAG